MLGTRRALLLTALATAGSAACSGAIQTGPTGPRWEGPLFELFPDDIDPGALGLPTENRPTRDPRFKSRTTTAEVVARVRIQTVSVERRSNGDPNFRIGLQLATPRLVNREDRDRAPLEDALEVVIEPGGAAHGLARAWDVRLQGKTFVGFFKRFVNDEGEQVVHFHLAPDTKEVGDAIQEIVALGEVRGS